MVSGTESVDEVEQLLQLGAAAFVPRSKALSEVIDALLRVFDQHGQTPPALSSTHTGHAPGSPASPAVLALQSLTARQLDVLLMLDQVLLRSLRDITLLVLDDDQNVCAGLRAVLQRWTSAPGSTCPGSSSSSTATPTLSS